MEDLNLKIQKAIEENLPKQMGDVLQKRLVELEKAERDLKDLVDLYSISQKELKDTKIQLNEVKAELLIKKEFIESVNKLKESVEETQRNLKVREMEIKLSESEKRSSEMKELVGIVFKSPVYRENISKSIINSSEYNSQKGGYDHQPIGENITKTSEIE